MGRSTTLPITTEQDNPFRGQRQRDGISPETNDSVKPAGEYRSHDQRDFQAGARRLGFGALSVTAGSTLTASLSGATSSSYTTPARTLVVGNSGGERARPHPEGERSHLGHTNHRRPVTTTIQVQDAAAPTAAPLPSPSSRRLRHPPLPSATSLSASPPRRVFHAVSRAAGPR